MTEPVAPWILAGECLVGLTRRPPGDVGLPPGIQRVPGPGLVVAVAYESSPVGPYLELAVGEPARIGARAGWCLTSVVVDSAGSRQGGKRNWGFPKRLGSLVWRRDGDQRELRWVERDVVIRGGAAGPPLPFLVPMRTLQRRQDGPVIAPGRLRGVGRLTRVEVEAPPDDPLAPLRGRHLGVHVAGLRLRLGPARRPVGLGPTLRAPLRSPEPALWCPSQPSSGD